MKSGCSTAGCHTANVTISGEMQVGEQARQTHRVCPQNSVKIKKRTHCPVGGGRINKHPPHINSLIWGGTPLARTVDTLLTDACGGCIIASKSTYGGVHIGIVLIIHHFFLTHFATGFSEKILMSSAKKIFRHKPTFPRPHQLYNSCHYYQEKTTEDTSLTKSSDKS